MKRIIYALISCLVLAYVPVTSYAEKKIYIESQTSSDSSGPKRGDVLDILNILNIEACQDSCVLCITLLDDVTNLGLYLTKNGVTYEEDELDALTGQTIVYDLENYDTGEYDLTITVGGNVIATIAVIIEE
ncbi:MAG: DUF3244 domain-containing protein [Prevotella sp.]|nr:DUF3244 domain-containing protein [Prevotella sp.]